MTHGVMGLLLKLLPLIKVEVEKKELSSSSPWG